MNQTIYIIKNGIAGISGSALSVVMTFVETCDAWLRFLGTILGICVAILTILNLLKTLRK